MPSAEEPLPAGLTEALARADPTAGVAPAAALAAAHRALALAEAAGDVALAARVGSWACVHAFRAGDFAAVRRTASAIAPHLNDPRAEGLTEARNDALRAATLAALEAGACAEALGHAQTLAVAAARQHDPGTAVTAAFALAATCERMGDAWQALRIVEETRSMHAEAATPAFALMLLVNAEAAICIGLFHRLRGVADVAECAAVLARGHDASTLAARLLTRAAPDAAYEVAVHANRGELLLHQGDLAGARAGLLPALSRATALGLRAHGFRVRVTLAELALAEGAPADALAAMQRLLSEMGREAPPTTEMRAHHVAYRAARALGDAPEALARFEAFERLERERALHQLRTQSQLFVTRAEAQAAQRRAEQAFRR
jgi:tetratricopeptide (TPR) repeat protein